MNGQHFITEKTIFSITGISLACWIIANVIHIIFPHLTTDYAALIVLILALLMSFAAIFESKKRKKTFKLYLAALINSLLITLTSIGVNNVNSYAGSDNGQKKSEGVNKSSLIPFFDDDIWLPPAKLVNEIKQKTDSIDKVNDYVTVLTDKDNSQNRYIVSLKNRPVLRSITDSLSRVSDSFLKKGNEAQNKNNINEALENYKKAYDTDPGNNAAFEKYKNLKLNKNFPEKIKK